MLFNTLKDGRTGRSATALSMRPLVPKFALPIARLLCAIILISVVLAAARLDSSNDATAGQVGMFVTFPAMIGLFVIFGRNTFRAFSSAEGKSIALLAYLMLISYTLGNDIFSPDDRILTLSNIIGIPMVFLVGYLMVQIKGIQNTLALSALCAVIVQSLIIIFTPAQIVTEKFERATGLFNDPNIVILHIIPVFLLGWAFATRSLEKIILLFAAPLILTAVALSASRSGSLILMGTLSLVLVFPILIDRTIVRTRAVLWIGLMAVVGTVLMAGLFFEAFDRGISSLSYRFTERTDESGFLGDRLVYISMLADRNMFDLLNPFGMSYRTFLQTTDTLIHNTFLDFYIIAGPIALFLFGSLYYRAVRSAVSTALNRSLGSSSRWHAWLMFCSICGQALLLSSLSVISMKVHWLVLGIAVGSVNKYVKRPSHFGRVN